MIHLNSIEIPIGYPLDVSYLFIYCKNGVNKYFTWGSFTSPVEEELIRHDLVVKFNPGRLRCDEE